MTLLCIELLKFAHPKSFQVKSVRSKISSDRTYTQRKSLFREFKKIFNFQTSKRFGPEKYPAYLKLPWIGSISLKYEKRIKSTVNNYFESVLARIVFPSNKILPSFEKDVLPSHQQSNIVYKYSCHCDSVYVGKASQGVEERI